MALFEWKPSYSVGIKQIDDQHLKIIDNMNRFHESHHANRPKEAQESLKTLLDVTKSHFMNEESMMSRNGYPDLESHKELHKQLLTAVETLAGNYQKETTGKNADTLSLFLRNWLSNHIFGVDKRYGPFLNAKGIK